MSNAAIVVETIEQLQRYLDENGVLEIVIRQKNQRFKVFQKVILRNTPQSTGEAQTLLENVTKVLNKNVHLSEKNLKMVSNIAKLDKIGLLLNGLNLCATCAGFAIIYAKLDKMSAEIGRQLSQLQEDVKKVNDIQADYEFSKVLSSHTDMLDCRKKQKPYPEDKMRELVDAEYNVLLMLINVLKKDASSDHEALIFSIFSLLSMLTVSICFFDEQYYQNNHEKLEGTDIWHASHEKWMSVYGILSSEWFVEKLQDYCMFETKMSTREIDLYYISLIDQVHELQEEVTDNQKLILAVGDMDLLHKIKVMSIQEVKDEIDEAYRLAGGTSEDHEVFEAFKAARDQAVVA